MERVLRPNLCHMRIHKFYYVPALNHFWQNIFSTISVYVLQEPSSFFNLNSGMELRISKEPWICYNSKKRKKKKQAKISMDIKWNAFGGGMYLVANVWNEYVNTGWQRLACMYHFIYDEDGRFVVSAVEVMADWDLSFLFGRLLLFRVRWMAQFFKIKCERQKWGHYKLNWMIIISKLDQAFMKIFKVLHFNIL